MLIRFEQLNYYEVLELPVNASSFEIEQAYKEALSTYDEDSLSTYSLFTREERETILKRVEEAFLTLIDQNHKASYDKRLLDAGELDAGDLKKDRPKKPIALFPREHPEKVRLIAKRVKNKIQQRPLGDHEGLLSKDQISGNDLREIRISLGIELQEIFEITRIRVSTLRAIEEDQFDALPPMIYMKNFLRSYCEALGLDEDKIFEGYVEHMGDNT